VRELRHPTALRCGSRDSFRTSDTESYVAMVQEKGPRKGRTAPLPPWTDRMTRIMEWRQWINRSLPHTLHYFATICRMVFYICSIYTNKNRRLPNFNAQKFMT
jgi:hypothetical protein